MPYTYANLGQSNGSGDALALFDDEFTGEVRHTFQTKTAFLDKQRIRRITNAKGATFSSYGRLTGEYHIPGTELGGQNVGKAETYIPVDNKFAIPVWVPDILEAMSNIDDRREIRMELAYGLSKAYDQNSARNITLGARVGSDLTARPGGRTGGVSAAENANIVAAGGTIDSRLRSATASTVAADLRALISGARLSLDEDDVPDDDDMTYTALRPMQYHLLAQSPGVEMNRDYGGMGSAAMSVVPVVAGTRLFKTNHLPGTDLTGSAPTNGPTQLYKDFSQTIGLTFHASAAGTVQLLDVTYERDRVVERQADLIVGSFAFGQGILRPEAIRELTVWDGVS